MSSRPFEGLNNRERWQEQALCRQVDVGDLFFPEKGESVREAKRTCLDCPVQLQCLQYALDHDERFGVWGGLSERERRRLKRGLPLKPPKPPRQVFVRVCDGCGCEFTSTAMHQRFCRPGCRRHSKYMRRKGSAA